MAPKKGVTGVAAVQKDVKEKKAAAAPNHPAYKDMIKEAILNLKERNGSSRQGIKKYVKANNKITVTSETQFDSLFNKALKTGVDKGDFNQPKGPSGPVKIAKKEVKQAEKKAALPKKDKVETKPKVAKKAAPKKAASKASTTKAKPATKAKTAAAAKPKAAKANTATKRASKPKAEKKTAPAAPAPAVVDVPTVLKKTASGRVTKQKAAGATARKPAGKKAKATPKKA